MSEKSFRSSLINKTKTKYINAFAVENYANEGTPDVFVNTNKSYLWIELKVENSTNKKIRFENGQPIFLYRPINRSIIVIKCKTSYYLFKGGEVFNLQEGGIKSATYEHIFNSINELSKYIRKLVEKYPL